VEGPSRGFPTPSGAASDHALMAAAFAGSRALLLVIGPDGHVLVANPAMTAATGWTPEELAARPFWETFVVPEDRPRAHADFARAMATGVHFTVEGDWTGRDGGRRRISMQVDVLLDEDGRPCAESLVGVDVTDQRREEERLRRRAETDALTGLANRHRLVARLHEALADDGPGAGVLFCDLDGFKAVNDRDGHHAGDLLLVEVARRVAAAAAPGELVGRLGGDEFVVVSPGADRGRLEALADDVRVALSRPVDLRDAAGGAPQVAAVEVGASTGWAVGPPGSDADEVLRAADRRMYRAKTARRRVRARGR